MRSTIIQPFLDVLHFIQFTPDFTFETPNLELNRELYRYVTTQDNFAGLSKLIKIVITSKSFKFWICS